MRGERREDNTDILYRIPFTIEIYLKSYLLSIPPLPFAPLFILFVYLSFSFLFFSFLFFSFLLSLTVLKRDCHSGTNRRTSRGPP